jgi:hypothetical protein
VGECEFSPGSRIQIRVDSIYIQYCYTLRDTERSVVKWEGAWYYGNSYIQHRDGIYNIRSYLRTDPRAVPDRTVISKFRIII